MLKFDFIFILLHLSTILALFMFVYIFKMNNKKQIHYAFLGNMGFMFIWFFAVLIRQYVYYLFDYDGKVFMIISYFGVCYLPVTLLFTGIIFAHTEIRLTRKHLLFFIPPTFSYLVLLTNDYHKLFYLKYSFFDDQIINGKYFAFHTVFLYIYVIISFYYLIYFSIKNSGFFSKQSLLIVLGTSFPLIVNILYSFKIIALSAVATPVAFTFAVICYMFAILKFNFLNITPIALQKVVDLISDSFIVVNEQLNIVDYNRTFMYTFSEVFKIRRNDNIKVVLDSNQSVEIEKDKIYEYIGEVQRNRKSITFETRITSGVFDKYFTIEITPIVSHDKYIGTIILFKDITQSKKDLETIKENQAMLMERERLASLGQLIGGIAHNLKTPIMSISGGLEALKDLAKEYDDSIEDKNVTPGDHHEIAREMLQWLEKIRPHCSYMSDIISAVKGQAVQLNDSSTYSFRLDGLVKRVDLLMKHELTKNHCTIMTDFRIDLDTEVKGEVNNLVQILDNMIINAIHSYEGRSGEIEFKIVEKDNNIIISIADNGKGMPKDVQSRLFKEMITTKGKNGTGLGMYMSYSTIKGRFGGNIWFDSEEGKGTTFYISIPKMRGNLFQGVS